MPEYYSQRLQKAINLAIQTHSLDQAQFRKGTKIPYIIHPLLVGMLLAKVTKDEDVIIAGILHDVVEDSVKTKKITVKFLQKEFGNKVSNLVAELSEDDKDIVSWEERKRKTVLHIGKMSKEALLVKAANMLQNLSDTVTEYKQKGKEMFNNFNAGKDAQLEKNRKYTEALTRAWNKNPFLPEVCAKLDELVLLYDTN